jgi:hypothetical protein
MNFAANAASGGQTGRPPGCVGHGSTRRTGSEGLEGHQCSRPHPEAVEFTVKIQAFGGAAVGRWTLEIGPFLFCVEVVTSGQIRIRYA